MDPHPFHMQLVKPVPTQEPGVFGAETDEMKTEEVKTAVGQSVTLHSGVEEYHQISWMLGPQDRNIAKCRGNTDGTRSCEIDERLRDRLKIDSQTGSLTIINISTELTGLYKLQIIDSSSKKSSYKQFNVTVSAPLPIPTIVKDCEQSSSSKCVLLCSVTNVRNQPSLCWYKGESLISSTSVSGLNNSFSLPLEVNYQDINIYSCVLNNSISNQTKHLNIAELCQLSPGMQQPQQQKLPV
ncbi:uncharacterized protein LOC107719715 [Sinocyclocheilus rhinocerous]|uniref:uncharacterized protein LOC107719715 n=1 Tax=Sinocyclocheilus rhinocerous TaxID=307959 RepID=UPI0007BA2A34|nr:PREDICTED: uncharacterized protein LOC107719715 [Sinocyclocheilus rhinocerous]